MTAHQTVEINSIDTVLRELVPLIEEVQRTLQSGLENDRAVADAGEVARRLAEIRGTLQLLDLTGPATLSAEMRALANAIAEGDVEQVDSALESLLKAVFRLPDYLDRLRSGHRDVPTVLLPLINELRRARGEAELDERAVFFPQLERKPAAPGVGEDDAALQATARRLRPRFQRALLGWYRGGDVERHLGELGGILQELAGATGSPAAVRLWSICGALTESLADQGLEGDNAIKVLMGRVERLLSRLVREGAPALESGIPLELLRNLLYYVARSGSDTARVREVKRAYQLDELLPGSEAHADFEGPNRDLLGVVGDGIREDLAQIKDAVELYVHSDSSGGDTLQGLPERLHQVAETFAMLGLQEAHDTLDDEADVLARIDGFDAGEADQRLQALADVLLQVENDLTALQSGRPAGAAQDPDALSIRALPDSEYRPLLSGLVAASLDDLARVREAIGVYCDDPEAGREAVAEAPNLLDEVHGAIAILPLASALPLIEALGRYVRSQFVGRGSAADEQTQMLLADVVAGLEYYLEAVDHDRAGMTHLLESANRAMAALESGGEPETHTEDDQVVIEAPLEAPEADAEPLAGDGADWGEADHHPDAGLEWETPAEAGADGAGDGADTSAPPDQPETPGAGDPDPGDRSTGLDGTELDDIGLEDIELADLNAGTDETGAADPALDGGQASAGDVDGSDGAAETGTDAAPPHAATDDVPPSGGDGAVEAPGVVPVDEAGAVHGGDPRGTGIDPGASGSSQLAILGEDADDEIVEVFVEEALGELDKINENLPRWKADPGDEEPLIIVRRAYHTLKGGGRLIGAELIGEFSWSMENMLNRVIDQSIDPTPAVSDTLDEAAAALPQLIEQLQGNRAPIAGIDDLIERAHALSRGEQGPPPSGGDGSGDGPDGGGTGHHSDGPESSGGDAPVSGAGPSGDGGARAAVHGTITEAVAGHAMPDYSDGVDDHPALERSGIVVSEADDGPGQSAPMESAGEPTDDPQDATAAEGDASGDETAGSLDAVSGTGNEPATGPANEDQQASAGDGSSAGEADAGAGTTVERAAPEAGSAGGAPTPHASGDPLTDIFLREAAGHQAVLHRELGHVGDDTGALQANDDIVRALHTLVGSAQTVEADTVADLAVRMERIVKARQDQHDQLDADTVMLFQQTLKRVDDALAALAGGETVASDDLLGRLDSVLEEVEQARAARDESESELLDIFIEEGDEILETCDRAVAQWREAPDDTRVIPDLQRGLHTLKGGARMANFPPIADLTHEVESLIDAVADGDCNLSEDVFDLLQEAVDALTVLLEQARNRNDVSRIDWLVEDLRTLREQQGGGSDRRSEAPAAPAAAQTTGGDPSTGEAGDDARDAERAGSPEATDRPEPTEAMASGSTGGESRASEPATTSSAGPEQIRVQSDLLDNLVNFAGEVSIYHSRINEQLGQYRFNIQEFDQTVNRLRAQLRDMENETESQIRYSHAVEREQEPEEGEREAGFDPLEFDRYTRLHELSRSLSESVGDLDSLKEILDNVTRDAETLLLQQSRVSSELQDGLMQTRMVRFDGLRARLARVVRQTAGTVGKKVQMEMSGGELEVDRSIQERIVAPLEHVLRNAVSHGIESPEKRRANGKPEQGTIRLDLHRGGTDIVIDISDDGGGIDPAAVRRNAIEKGLIDADDDRHDNEVIKLILETGFSTADEVTQISGRGVGMDVVDAEIRRLGGTLGIQTELGSGTRFTVRLPVTLAINQAVMVQAGDDTYAIPIASIEGVAQVAAGDLKAYYVDPTQPYHYAGNDYRVQHLGTMLGTSEPRLENEEVSYPVIMIRAGDDRVALHVDGLVGRREVVVKPLGAPLNMLPGISGATIMADGAVVLILDIGGLLRTEQRFVASVGSRAEAADDADTAEALDAGQVGEGARTARTVLVVDDSITIRKVTNRILERNGITVATAKDGVDALSWMTHTVPDLILLDIEMPRMDGYEVATYVRGDERLADVPIIMITSRTGEKHRERAEGIGVNRYLGKPYQEAELMEHINAVLDERTRSGEPA